jgi:hypothetical protein
MNEKVSLPDLQDAMLSRSELLSYLDELIQAQVNVRVSIKGAPQERPARFEGLQHLRKAVSDREIHSAQLRYSYQGVHWVDTLMLQEKETRLVRMQVSDSQ